MTWMNKKQKILLTIKPWQCLLLSVAFSEILTSLMALILKGRVSPDYLITGFVVSMIVASIVIYILYQVRGIESRAKALLKEAYQSLEEKVDARSSDLACANEKLRAEVSERIKAQKVIKDSDNRYRDLFNGISDLIMIHDLKGRLLSVNPAVCKLSGYTLEELIGRPISDLITPKFRPLFQDEYLQHIIKQKHLEGVVIFQAKDETDHYVEFRNILINHEGSEPYISGSGRDVTEQMRAEKALKEAKRTAEAANLAKSEFLANMSHELRTPLNHIIGFTELVVDKNFGEINEVQEGYLNDVLQSSRHLLSLINDILDFSKLDAGVSDFEPVDVNIKMLFRNALAMIKDKVMNRDVRVLMDTDRTPEYVTADDKKLKKIIYNLLSNAVKFTPNGGEIRLTSDLTDGSLPLADSNTKKASGQKLKAKNNEPKASQKFIRISVTDTGIGIKPENQARIFDAFEQVDGSASKRYQGSGLGLSLTKQLVELHGGIIWVDSEGEGKGSAFRFIIPLQI
jgi:PAS domain S-box-containing protein